MIGRLSKSLILIFRKSDFVFRSDEGSRPTTPLPITPRSSRAEPIASSSAPPKMSKFDELVKDRIKIDIDLDF